MCGIVGQIQLDPDRHVEAEAIHRMADIITHRGPDGEGVWIHGQVGLGHRRLKIIDLSDAAKQPMGNADGSLWITFNGEIYNYRELRGGLETEGVRFRSNSDTEVLLSMYERHGFDCLQHLIGMFAFAIWDDRKKLLFAARDRMGQKPFFYTQTKTSFLFGSEIKSILVHNDVPREPDQVALQKYLSLQFVPHPLTAFAGIKRLPHAHYLVWKDGQLTLERYWKIRYLPKLKMSEEEINEELVNRLEIATQSQMISDVPLGAFLSGGVDSSGVVAMMARNSSEKVKTFSIGFEEEGFSELPYAKEVSHLFNTEHHEFVVRPDAVSILPQLVWHYNEPFADSSAVPTWYVAKMTREYVTVALNGDAGDENFGGYLRHLALFLANGYAHLPRGLRKLLRSARRLIPDAIGRKGRFRLVKRFLETSLLSPAEMYALWISHFSFERKQELCTPEFLRSGSGEWATQDVLASFWDTDADGWAERAMAVDLDLGLPDDLLVKIDVATMAHGLEGRSPMLDHRFVEFAASIPRQFKVRGLQKKYILREAFRSFLPSSILDRCKQGFAVPIGSWFRGPLREMAHDVLLSERARKRGYFRTKAIENLLRIHFQKERNEEHRIWNLLMFELWHRQFVDGEPSPHRM